MLSIRKEVDIHPGLSTVGNLYQMASDRKIVVVDEWLQRLQQSKKWQAKNGAKTKSFLYSFFTGSSDITPFYFIEIGLLIQYVESEIEKETDDIRKIVFQDLLEKLLHDQSNNAEYVLLDGQNRLFEGIVPFFQGTLKNNSYKRPFHFFDDEKNEWVKYNDFKYTNIDLPQEVKDIFYNTRIVIAQGVAGSIDSYVDSIVDMNNGEPWTLFESTIIRPKALCYLINKDIFRDPIIQALFGNDELEGSICDMSGTYEIQKKGDARMIAELVYGLGHNFTSGLGSEETVSNMLLDSDNHFVMAYDKVKKYLDFISKTLKCLINAKNGNTKKPLDKNALRNLIMLFDMMVNPSNCYYRNCPIKVRSLDEIKQPFTIIEQFIRWHDEKNDKKVTPQDFGKNDKPKPDTYAFNNRGTNKDNIDERLHFINEWVANNAEDWVAKSYIMSDSVDYRDYKIILQKENGYKDKYTKGNSKFGLRDNLHIDHVKPRKSGGTNEVDNLVVTRPKPNLIKSDRY